MPRKSTRKKEVLEKEIKEKPKEFEVSCVVCGTKYSTTVTNPRRAYCPVCTTANYY